MSTFEVTIEQINVFPHPDADRLELARVGLYNVVIPKDVYNTGDWVLYIPEYSVLPDELIETLGLTGKLSGSHNNRVKPVKLRGALSQGLVAPLSVLPDGTKLDMKDYAPILGIEKWQPVIPTSMSGEVEANTELINWIDIENLKKFPDTFTPDDVVAVSEKIHGSATLTTFRFENGKYDAPVETIVSSKGLGEKAIALKENDNVIYWRTLKENKLDEVATHIAKTISKNEDPVFKVAIFGEVFGSKVQDLHYGKTNGELGFAIFDVYVEFRTEGRWLNPTEVDNLTSLFDVKVVPTLWTGSFNLETVIELASGKETISGKEAHIREGVVIRLVNRPRGYRAGSERIAKYVSDDYLTRKGGTEYN